MSKENGLPAIFDGPLPSILLASVAAGGLAVAGVNLQGDDQITLGTSTIAYRADHGVSIHGRSDAILINAVTNEALGKEIKTKDLPKEPLAVKHADGKIEPSVVSFTVGEGGVLEAHKGSLKNPAFAPEVSGIDRAAIAGPSTPAVELG